MSIVIEDAYLDTPEFRSKVKDSSTSMNILEQKVKRIASLVDRLSTISTEFTNLQNELVHDIKNISSQPASGHSIIFEKTSILTNSLTEIEKSRILMMSHIKDVLVDPLQHFIATFVVHAKKLGKECDSALEVYENSMSKYASRSKRDTQLAENGKEVAKARKVYHRKLIEYCVQLNEIEKQRNYEITDHYICWLYTQFAFFHQGFEVLKDAEPTLDELTQYIVKIKEEHLKIPKLSENQTAQLLREDPAYNPHKTDQEISHYLQRPPRTISQYKSGYLLKRSKKLMVSWERMYFELRRDSLIYYDTLKEAPTLIDLRICMVKETVNPERRNCFDILLPSKSITIQAQNEIELYDWIATIQNAIGQAFHPDFKDNSTNSLEIEVESEGDELAPKVMKTSRILHQVRSVDGNQYCADCGSEDRCEWASFNLGIILCITCSGIHRGLGRHISKTRSLVLDKWEIETVHVFVRLGNVQVNAIFEALYNESSIIKKPVAESSRPDKEKWCAVKYVERRFITKGEFTEIPLVTQFLNALRLEDIPMMLKCIVLGFDVNSQDLNGRMSLHHSCSEKLLVSTEFLLLWFANPNLQDLDGKTPLHHVTQSGSAELVCLLLQRNSMNLKDKTGRLPIEYAEELSRSNGGIYIRIVTMLRLTKFEKEHIHNHKSVTTPTSHETDTIFESSSVSKAPLNVVDRHQRYPSAKLDLFESKESTNIQETNDDDKNDDIMSKSCESLDDRKEPTNIDGYGGNVGFDDDPWAQS